MWTPFVSSRLPQRKGERGGGGGRGEEKDRLDECKHIQTTTTTNLLQANQAQAGINDVHFKMG